MPKFNKRFIDDLKPVTKDTLYRDLALTGFILRIKPSGVATWGIQYRDAQGRTKRYKLGAARKIGQVGSAVLAPEEARQRAKKALGRVANGEDPSALPSHAPELNRRRRVLGSYVVITVGAVNGLLGGRGLENVPHGL
jgi:hypothetical protein